MVRPSIYRLCHGYSHPCSWPWTAPPSSLLSYFSRILDEAVLVHLLLDCYCLIRNNLIETLVWTILSLCGLCELPNDLHIKTAGSFGYPSNAGFVVFCLWWVEKKTLERKTNSNTRVCQRTWTSCGHFCNCKAHSPLDQIHWQTAAHTEGFPLI